MKIFIYSLIALLSQSVLADVSGLTFVAFAIETTDFKPKADSAILLKTFDRGLETRSTIILSEVNATANETYYFDGTRKQ